MGWKLGEMNVGAHHRQGIASGVENPVRTLMFN